MIRLAVGMFSVCAFLASTPAFAAGSFVPPNGCALDLTVQMRGCQMANVYHCETDPEGERWISYADSKGEYFLSRIDYETRWLESISLIGGEIDRLDEAASKDHSSFSTLLAQGRDAYDFVTQSNFGQTRRQIGADWLVDEHRTVDGITLQRCDFRLETRDTAGNLIARRKGVQYIDPVRRIFYSGPEHYSTPDGTQFDTDNTPVAFATEGDAGFGATKPTYGCDLMMTGLRPEDLQ